MFFPGINRFSRLNRVTILQNSFTRLWQPQLCETCGFERFVDFYYMFAVFVNVSERCNVPGKGMGVTNVIVLTI